LPYDDYLRQLAQAEGVENSTKEQHDPSARITKMKDGRTKLAYKAEHAVDLASGALLAVTVQPADRGDTTSYAETLEAAQRATENTAVVSGLLTELVERVLVQTRRSRATKICSKDDISTDRSLFCA
ncbi:MAG: hypothetical protein ABI833_14210, partial [Acidobacteriota bacterium]